MSTKQSKSIRSVAVLAAVGVGLGMSATTAAAADPTASLSITSDKNEDCWYFVCGEALNSVTFRGAASEQMASISSVNTVEVQGGGLLVSTTNNSANSSENVWTWNNPTDVKQGNFTASMRTTFVKDGWTFTTSASELIPVLNLN